MLRYFREPACPRPNANMEDPMSDSSAAPFAAWLEERCAFLRNLEAEANRTLYEKNDADRYRELMRQKALFLSAIADEAGPYLASLPRDKASLAEKVLERFSASAENSLSIGSVFYMSALLYPEDHKDGQPNDLEIFAAEIAGW